MFLCKASMTTNPSPSYREGTTSKSPLSISSQGFSLKPTILASILFMLAILLTSSFSIPLPINSKDKFTSFAMLTTSSGFFSQLSLPIKTSPLSNPRL